MHIKIENLEHLKKACKDRSSLDCFILLNRGLRSSKTLLPDEDMQVLSVFNEIDGSSDEFESWEELFDENRTNIGKAIKSGAFFAFDYENVRSFSKEG